MTTQTPRKRRYFMHAFVCVRVCICVCMYINIHLYMHICTYIYSYTYIYMYIFTHVIVPSHILGKNPRRETIQSRCFQGTLGVHTINVQTQVHHACMCGVCVYKCVSVCVCVSVHQTSVTIHLYIPVNTYLYTHTSSSLHIFQGKIPSRETI